MIEIETSVVKIGEATSAVASKAESVFSGPNSDPPRLLFLPRRKVVYRMQKERSVAYHGQ